jgi:Domain of unknown function (DUF4389)
MEAPVRLVLTDDLHRSRLTVFFRLLLALPHLVWLVLWAVAVVVAAVLTWIATLVTGRPPEALHRFLCAFVRYGVHLGAYLSVTANPFPSFTGDRGYPIDVELPGPAPQPRWKTALRLPLAVPALLVLGAVGGAGGPSGRCAFLGWFASLARGRMPNGLRDLSAYGIGYSAQTWAYLLLLTDRYPTSDPDASGPHWSLRPHAVTVQEDDDGRRSRLTVLFRLLLALPHLVWLALWSAAATLAAFLNGIHALIRGRSASPLHRFLTAYVRYGAHVVAFVCLVGNRFPGFTGAPPYALDIALDPPGRQSRWITLFRGVLVLPAAVISGALTSVLCVIALLGWLASLLTGGMPDGLRKLGVVTIRYLAQTSGYWLIVTDQYPYAAPALRAPPADVGAAELEEAA